MFSTAAFAARLDLVNIGAAGTFVSPRPVTATAIARALPFETAVAIRPASEVIRLVDGGPPRVPAGALVFVSVLMKIPTKRPALPLELPAGGDWMLRAIERRGAFVICARRIDRQRGVDLSAVLARAFGVPFTTRSWNTMERIAAAIRAL
ncbi:MAG TPA: hypothetical protein VIN70_03775 [Candidatus Limnocylindria bacterium]